MAEWGRDAPKKLDVVMSRFALMTDAMSPQDQKKFDAFLNNMTALTSRGCVQGARRLTINKEDENGTRRRRMGDRDPLGEPRSFPDKRIAALPDTRQDQGPFALPLNSS